MATVSKRELEAYDERLTAIADAAGEAAMRAYDALRAQNLTADVAEVRESAIELIMAVLDSYGDMACEEAAQFYDGLAEKSGAKVRPAELPEVQDDMRAAVRKQVRYAVGVLVDDREDM